MVHMYRHRISTAVLIGGTAVPVPVLVRSPWLKSLYGDVFAHIVSINCVLYKRTKISKSIICTVGSSAQNSDTARHIEHASTDCRIPAESGPSYGGATSYKLRAR